MIESFLAVSLCLNAYLLWQKAHTPPKQESYEVKELMSDLLSGSALIKIERIAPADVILRSPRGRE